MIIKTSDKKVIPVILDLLEEELDKDGKYTPQQFLKWYREVLPQTLTWVDMEEDECKGFAICLINQTLIEEYITILYING